MCVPAQIVLPSSVWIATYEHEIERMGNAGSDTKSDFVEIIGKWLEWRIVQKQCY